MPRRAITLSRLALILTTAIGTNALAVGCARVPVPQYGGTGGEVTLHVAAASDLQVVLPALIDRYRAEAPGVKVVPVFGSSGQLAEQVKAGAPFDLFLAANEAFVKDLATENSIVPASIRPYALGSLVLASRSDLGAPVESPADLTKTAVKTVSIANPDVAPYGAAARQALKKAGLWETLKHKLVTAESVRQALTYVETGDADAGFASKALVNNEKVRAFDVDPSLYDPIVQTLGVVARSEHAEAAEAFARFLVGDASHAVFASHGFKRPGGP
jgi:molybdate transport system substrate-binding protein